VKEAAIDVSIEVIHTNNSVNSTDFHAYSGAHCQKLYISGVGAHQQNGLTENAINLICNEAQTNAIHTSIYYPE
jgi:hypothetical protein